MSELPSGRDRLTRRLLGVRTQGPFLQEEAPRIVLEDDQDQ
ncbi:hypothetical protein [Streptomyces sp. NPDC050564]